MRVDLIEHFFNKLDITDVKYMLNDRDFIKKYKTALNLFFYPEDYIDMDLYLCTNQKLSGHLTYEDIDLLFEYYNQNINICISPALNKLELVYVADDNEKLYIANLYLPLNCLNILKNELYINKVIYNPNTVSIYGISNDTLIFQSITMINEILKDINNDIKNVHCNILHIDHTNYDIQNLKQIGYIKCLGDEFLVLYNTDNIIILNKNRTAIFNSEHYALILQNIINDGESDIRKVINKNIKERLNGYFKRDE